jgi:hypothetical protein
MTRAVLISFVAVLTLVLICVGCSGLSTNPSRAAKTISGWVPVGTSQDDVGKIMTQHGFTLDYCDVDGHGGRDYHFYHVTKFHSWLAQIHVQDGKVVTVTVPRVFFELIPIKT